MADLSKYKKTVDLSKYRTQEAGPFRFPAQESQDVKIKNAQAAAAQSEREAQQANSFSGMAKNFGSAFVENLAGGTVGMGQNIAAVLNAGDTTALDAQKQSTDSQVALLKKIREQKAKGFDTTRLERAYNASANSSEQLTKDINTQSIPTAGKVLKDAAFMVLETGALPAVKQTPKAVNRAGSALSSVVKMGPERTIAKRANVLTTLEKNNRQVADAFAEADRKGVDARKVLAETDLLNGAVDTNGTISTQNALANFDTFIKPYEGQVRKTLVAEGRASRVEDVAQAMDAFVTQSSLPGAARMQLIKTLEADLKGMQAGGKNIPLSTMHDIKVFRQQHNNYTDEASDAVSKEAARFFKEYVENNSKAMNVKTFNAELSKLYSVRDVLKKLDRKKVEGGRLGKYFSTIVGAGVGTTLGPIGTIAGAEAGRRIAGAQLKGALGGAIDTPLAPSDELIRTLPKPRPNDIPDVVIPKNNQAIPDLDLQSSSISSGQRNIAQSASSINSIPRTLPRGSNPSNYAGGITGIQQDENGEMTFSPEAALAGMAGITVAQKRSALTDKLGEVNALINKTTDQRIKKQYAKVRDQIKLAIRNL